MANELKRSKRIVIGGKELEGQINPENTALLQRYDRDMQMRELSEKSIYSYKCDIIAWFKYLVKKQFNPIVTDLNEDDIEEFIFYTKEMGNHTERIKRRMASISAFYKFLRKKKVIKENPMEFLDRPKKGLPVVTQTFLTLPQYELMKLKLSECGNLLLQTYAMLSVSTMGRVNAIANTQWSQINFEERVIDDVLEKEGKIVTLYFSEEVRDLLLKLKQENLENKIDCSYVFCTLNKEKWDRVTTSTLGKWTLKVGEMIDVPTLHPHDYRHSGSQLLNLGGMPIEMISTLLNHSGLDVTKNFYLKQDKKKIQAEKDKFKL